VIQRRIENPLARRILAAEFGQGDTVRIDASPDGELTFNGSPEAAQPRTAAAAPGGSTGTIH
jgi:hypothetical protein